MDFNKCIFCQKTSLLVLKNSYLRCKTCKKKYSLKYLKQELKILELFCENFSANEASKKLALNYKTISQKYKFFRQICAIYLQNLYYKNKTNKNIYEEFYYFTKKQKLNKKKSLFEAINIIAFYENKRIFCILMPKLNKSGDYKSDKIFETYLSQRKIKENSLGNAKLKNFWLFLEKNLLKYKGINQENFFYYLKESEFKYNFSKTMAKKILQKEFLNYKV